MKVILLQPPVWGIYEPPIALAQISACLEKNDIDVSVYDLNIKLYNQRTKKYQNDWTIERSPFWFDEKWVETYFNDNIIQINEHISCILDYNPEVICFSVNANSWHATRMLAERILQRKNVKIVLGGPVFLVPFHVNQYFKHNVVDIVIYGEGEKTMVNLMNILKNGRSIHQCEGICYRDGGDVQFNPPASLIKNLDELPFLNFKDTPFEEYDPPEGLKTHFSLMASRGCVQRCRFCGPIAYWKGYRSMTGKRIYDEICHHIKNHSNIEHIEFLDLLLNGNMAYLEDFCDLMIKKMPKDNLVWHSNMIIRKEMTFELMKKLKKAGCKHVTYGIESGSQQVLNLMNKRYLISDANNVLKNTHEAGIKVTCNFMFGFPGETEENFQETLEFLDKNKEYIDNAYPSRTYCTIEPYSYMDSNREEFNIKWQNNTHGQYWELPDGKNNFLTRLNRCIEFSEYAIKKGVQISQGVQSIELDKALNTAIYYDNIGEYEKALFFYEKSLKLDSNSGFILNQIEKLKNK